MLKGIACLLMGATLVGGYYFFQNRAATTSALADVQGQPTDAKPEGKEPSKTEAVAGALAQWMEHQTQSQAPEERREAKAHPSDHIAESPVGTSSAIVKKRSLCRRPQSFPLKFQRTPPALNCMERFIRLCGRREVNRAMKMRMSIFFY